MKKYLIYSTLSFVFISFLIELVMSSNLGFTVFAGFYWFLSPSLFSMNNILTWIIQGLALSFAAYLYLQPKTVLTDGLRFGLITGLLFIMVILGNMLIHVDHSIYPFFTESLLPLITLQLLGFTINGWLFGLMFEIFSPEFATHETLWSLV